MLPHVQIAPEEYFASDYGKPDREFVHGELVERTMPDFEHGDLQGTLYSLLKRSHEGRRLFPAVEVRLRLGPNLVRIPDVLAFADSRPTERYPSIPPLVVVEILSPGDPYGDLKAKLRDYAAFGVEHIWVVDPAERELQQFRPGMLKTVASFDLIEYGVHITGADLFEVS